MAIRLQILAMLLCVQSVVAEDATSELTPVSPTPAAESPHGPAMVDDDVRLAGLESMVFSQASCAARPACVAKEASCPHWFALVDYLYWQTDRQDLGFAILDPAGSGVPSGGSSVQSLDLGSDSGVRTAIGRQFAEGWILGFTYTHMSASDSRSFAPGGSQVLAVQSSPATGLTNADSVVAATEFDYDVFDLTAGRWFAATDSL